MNFDSSRLYEFELFQGPSSLIRGIFSGIQGYCDAVAQTAFVLPFVVLFSGYYGDSSSAWEAIIALQRARVLLHHMRPGLVHRLITSTSRYKTPRFSQRLNLHTMMLQQKGPEAALKFLDFVNASPTPFHAVQSASIILDKAGFTKVQCSQKRGE